MKVSPRFGLACGAALAGAFTLAGCVDDGSISAPKPSTERASSASDGHVGTLEDAAARHTHDHDGYRTLLQAQGSTEVVSGYRLPFESGQRRYVTQYPHAYGNIIWNAVDIGMSFDEPLYAMRGGTISAVVDTFDDMPLEQDCTQSSCNDSTNFLIIQHDDGQESSYLHIKKGSVQALGLSPGDYVCQGQMIARIGHNGYTTGTHVHISVQSGGSSGGRNSAWGAMWSKPTKVIHFDEVGGQLSQAQFFTSQNDLDCDGQDPQAFCEVPDGGELVVEESNGQCFRRRTSYWWDGSGGHGGGSLYTWATDAGDADTLGTWRFDIAADGDYDVDVHIPSGGQSQAAVYHVLVDGQRVERVTLDQSAQSGWRNLTRRSFAAGDRVEIELPDNTGEPFYSTGDSRNTKLFYDAARVRPAQEEVAEDPPVEEPPVEDPPADDPPPVEEEPPVMQDDPPAEEPPTEQPPVEQPPAQEQPEDPAPSTPPANEEAAPEQEGEGTTVVMTGTCQVTGASPRAPQAPWWLGALTLGLLGGARRRRRR